VEAAQAAVAAQDEIRSPHRQPQSENKMKPPMDADVRRSELSAKPGKIGKPHRSAFSDQAMSRVEFRVCVHRRAPAVSSPFSD
jgi:hypothetical protein